MKTLVTEIQRFSIHDGPGIRTTVFLKGCPLRCEWCHNPECISPEKEEFFYPDKCIGCGKCHLGCYAGARVPCGKEMTPAEVLSEIMEDREYYGEDGGVTISGGEPLMHRDFTLALTKLCIEAGIKVALETTLYRFDEEILSLASHLMVDLKIFDSDRHKLYTGMGNETIKENIIRANSLGIPIWVRTPVVPGVNDTDENIIKTRDFLRGLENVQRYELLAYHPLGVSKARALGKEQKEFSLPSKERFEELKKYAYISR